MKTFTAATALLALSTSALAYQIQSFSAPNCGGNLLMDEGRTIGDGKQDAMPGLYPESLSIKLGDGENDGATVRVLFGDASDNMDHYQYYKIYAGDHSWRCINSDVATEPHPWLYTFV